MGVCGGLPQSRRVVSCVLLVCVVLCCIAYFFQKKNLSLSATKQLTKHWLCTTGTLFVYFVQSNEGNRFHEMCAYIEL